jgi:hypothetical protein
MAVAAVQAALRQLISELAPPQDAQVYELEQYAAGVSTIVGARFEGEAGASVTAADCLRACMPTIMQLQPAAASAESAERLHNFLARLEQEIADVNSTIFGPPHSSEGTSRVPKAGTYGVNANDGAGVDEDEEMEETGAGAGAGAGAPHGGEGAGIAIGGSDAYERTEADNDQAEPKPEGGVGPAEDDSPFLQFRIVKNDGSRRNLIWLTQVKNIFAAQLPKMPREYIARLVFDRKHRSMLAVKKDRVVGGICYRPFLPQRFAEIAFCAITASEQVKGYGTRLMNHTKEAVKMEGLSHFLTYADNYAIGYFKKQGFTKQVRLS